MAECEKSSEPSLRSQLKGIVYASLVVFLFAAFVLVSRSGLSTSLHLGDIAALRFGIGAMLLLPFLRIGQVKKFHAVEMLLLAALGGLGFALLAYAGFALAPASHGGVLIHGTLALTTYLLIAAFGAHRTPTGRRAGLGLIAVGVVGILWEGSAATTAEILLGDFCLIAASFSWSGYGLYAKKLGIPAVQAAAVVSVCSAVAFLPVYLLFADKMLLHADWRDLVVQAGFQGVLIGAGSIFIYTRATSLLGPEKVSTFTAAVPCLTLTGGLLFLGERPSPTAIVGASLVTAGMVVALRKKRRPVSKQTNSIVSKRITP